MNTTVEAIYEGGVLRLLGPVTLAEGAGVEVTVIQDRSPREESPPFHAFATAEERIKAFHAWVDSRRDITAPLIPEEVLRRENLYEDRGL